MTDMKKREQTNLEVRKQRLAALLQAEENQFEQEFQSSLETPEQVRAQMVERLNQLEHKREEERRQEVSSRMEKRFKATTDELRSEDAKFNNLGTQIYREQQLIDKRRAIDKNMHEEQIYAQLWDIDAQNKLAREQKEAEEKRSNVANTMAVLDWQKQTRELQRQREAEQVGQERQMLRNNWVAEEQAEKRMTQQQYNLNRERNAAIGQQNDEEQRLCSQASLIEKERDQQMLQKALAREEALKNAENEASNARREETVALQSFYQQQKESKAEYEKMIENLTAIENEKIQGKREAQWRREDQARINLLKNVYQHREVDIELKKTKANEAKWLTGYEKQEINQQIDLQNIAYAEKAAHVAMTKKANQTDILRQVGERDRQIRRDLQQKMFDERAAKLSELEYQKSINTQKQNNQEMLQTWKNSIVRN